MENASKALLIAGAILIVIVLIGIGVLIVNSTSGIQDQATSSADSMARQTFNSQFTAYEGQDNSAAQIRSLISTINASNGANAKQVNYTIKDATDHETTVKNGKLYTVELKYTDNNTTTTDGYVKSIAIKEQ